MQTDERIKMLLDAKPELLEAVDRVLVGQQDQQPVSLRLYRMGEACEQTGLSRTTLWRAIRDGRLRAVEVRAGSHRIPKAELIRFVEGAA